jgi:hypothetical protein
MLEQKKDAPGNPPYWVCTKCNWAFPVLREANQHSCGMADPVIGYCSYSRLNNITLAG